MEKTPDSNIRITIAPKGNMSKSKTVKISSDVKLKALFNLAKQKWKGKWNLLVLSLSFRCTLKDGTILSDETLKSVLHEDILLIFSHVQGEVKPATIEETKQAISEEMTVCDLQ